MSNKYGKVLISNSYLLHLWGEEHDDIHSCENKEPESLLFLSMLCFATKILFYYYVVLVIIIVVPKSNFPMISILFEKLHRLTFEIQLTMWISLICIFRLLLTYSWERSLACLVSVLSCVSLFPCFVAFISFIDFLKTIIYPAFRKASQVRPPRRCLSL